MSYPIIEINNLSELEAKIAALDPVPAGHQRLYRGQNNDYGGKMLPSLYRGDQPYTYADYSWKLAGQRIVKEEILKLGQRNIAEINDPSVIFPMDGMIQHYGLRSAGLDLTDDMHVALWFAQSRRIEERTMDHVMLVENKKVELFIFRKAYYEAFDADFAYLYIFECPLWRKGETPKNGDCVSLHQWYGQYTSRPAKQHAWYVYSDNVRVPRGDLQAFVTCAFKIPRSVRNELGPYRETSFYFPGPAEDSFYTRLLGSYFMKNENNLFERMLDMPQYYNNREEIFRNDDPWNYIPALRVTSHGNYYKALMKQLPEHAKKHFIEFEGKNWPFMEASLIEMKIPDWYVTMVVADANGEFYVPRLVDADPLSTGIRYNYFIELSRYELVANKDPAATVLRAVWVVQQDGIIGMQFFTFGKEKFTAEGPFWFRQTANSGIRLVDEKQFRSDPDKRHVENSLANALRTIQSYKKIIYFPKYKPLIHDFEM